VFKESGVSKATVTSLKPNPQPKRRVLVVDDNLDAVHSMAMLLRVMGHEVQFAINGFAAIDVARTFHPDVILLDVGLPDFRGDQIARQLKFELGMERVRMIAVTGRSDEETRTRVLAAGCEDLYVKPIAPSTLEEILDKV
jgi:CheY-like chemotaxis protein